MWMRLEAQQRFLLCEVLANPDSQNKEDGRKARQASLFSESPLIRKIDHSADTRPGISQSGAVKR